MTLRKLQPEFIFAGFTFPRYLARVACGSAALRAKADTRKFCGEYFHAPTPDARGERSFYLNSTGSPARWKYADECVSLRHSGWHTDDEGAGDTIRGLVVLLSHGRYLAGWTMGHHMASCVDTDAIYDSESDAAYAADSIAEYAAERERDYQREESARIEAEEQEADCATHD